MRLYLFVPLGLLGCSLLIPIDDERYLGGADEGGAPNVEPGTAGAETGGSPSDAELPLPLHHYAFDETVGNFPRDSGTSPRDGAILSTEAHRWSSDAQRGPHLTLLDNAIVEFDPSIVASFPLTLSLWIKPEKPELRAILDQQSGTTDAGMRLALVQTPEVNVPAFVVGGKTGSESIAATTPVAVGAWANITVALAVQGAQTTVRLWVNGVPEVDVTKVFAHPIPNSSTPFRLGRPAHNQDIPGFMGAIDDFRIYDVALNDAQVKALVAL